MATLTVQAPLTRRGCGPGLILVVPAIPDKDRAESRATLDPAPLQKWAEEGYTVVQIEVEDALLRHDLLRAYEALDEHGKLEPKSGFGMVFYGHSRAEVMLDIAREERIVAFVSNENMGLLEEGMRKPHLYHVAEKGMASKSTGDEAGVEVIYRYPDATTSYFLLPFHKDYSPAAAAIAHTRSLEFLKKRMGGPWFDLEEIWDEHTKFEFESRSVEETMSTMVEEPYVNHVPTMTGGIGRQDLSTFYAKHFIYSNPDDTALELVSRTVGIDRVVDEFIFSFTHDRVIDWLAPGIPPTGKKLRIPFTAIVNIRGDRLYHEHIAWDQLTVLFQMGLMPQYLPFPYSLPGTQGRDTGKKLEYRVPGAGHEVADKLVDESSVPSNEMFQFTVREVNSHGQSRAP